LKWWSVKKFIASHHIEKTDHGMQASKASVSKK